MDVPVDLSQEPSAYPEPTNSQSFTWYKDGQSLTSSRLSETTYSRLTFSTVLREDAGNYAVSATNYISESMRNDERIGSDMGNFQLDVICKLETTILTLLMSNVFGTYFFQMGLPLKHSDPHSVTYCSMTVFLLSVVLVWTATRRLASHGLLLMVLW